MLLSGQKSRQGSSVDLPPIRCGPLNMRHQDFNIIFQSPKNATSGFVIIKKRRFKSRSYGIKAIQMPIAILTCGGNNSMSTDDAIYYMNPQSLTMFLQANVHVPYYCCTQQCAASIKHIQTSQKNIAETYTSTRGGPTTVRLPCA